MALNPDPSGDRSNWPLRRVTDPAEQEADTYRYWHSRGVSERLQATWDVTEAAYSITRADHPTVKGLTRNQERETMFRDPPPADEMITFRLGEDGSMSESRKDGRHWDYGTDQMNWPPYVQIVANHVARCRDEEGWPDANAWFWIVRVKDLKQVLANNLSKKPHLEDVFAALDATQDEDFLTDADRDRRPPQER